MGEGTLVRTTLGTGLNVSCTSYTTDFLVNEVKFILIKEIIKRSTKDNCQTTKVYTFASM